MKEYKHLSDEERTLISHYHDNGISIGEIARKIGRNKSTVCRELKRNANKDGYHPATARRRYLAHRQKIRKIDRDPNLQAYIIDRLYEGFTPSAIAMRLKAFGAYEGV